MYRGFPTDSLQALRCCQTGCGGVLHAPTSEPMLWDRHVHCVRCGHAYPVREGILRLLDPSRLDAESTHEREMRDQQAVEPDYEWETTPWTRSEVVPTMQASQPLRASRVLEMGAGHGRYSVRMAESGADLIASDFSFNALRTLARRVQPGWRIGLVEADSTQLKVEPRAFDLVACTLMSNLPSAAHREAVYQVAGEALRDGGKFVFSTHHFSWRARLQGQQQSGYYREGGIYRYLFGLREIRREVSRHFGAVACRPVQIHLPLSTRLGLQFRLSRLSERIWPLNRLGELLLVTAQRPLRAVVGLAVMHGLLGDAAWLAESAATIL